MLLESSSHVRNSATGTQSRGGTPIFWSVLTVQSYDCYRISKDRHSDRAGPSALVVVSPNFPALRPCKEIGSDHQSLEFRHLAGGDSKLPRHEAQASFAKREAGNHGSNFFTSSRSRDYMLSAGWAFPLFSV